MKLKIYFDKPVYARSTRVFLIVEENNGRRSIAKPMDITFEPMPESHQVPASFEIAGPVGDQFFPALVNALAESGYRYESSDAGELKAAKKHLDDMRALVFDRKPAPEVMNVHIRD